MIGAKNCAYVLIGKPRYVVVKQRSIYKSRVGICRPVGVFRVELLGTLLLLLRRKVFESGRHRPAVPERVSDDIECFRHLVRHDRFPITETKATIPARARLSQAIPAAAILRERLQGRTA
jgi:hypothetical protein